MKHQTNHLIFSQVTTVTVLLLIPLHEINQVLEHKTPSVSRRIEAMEQLQACGWKLGLRFDPLIYHEDYEKQYQRLFHDVFKKIKADNLHSVNVGAFRLPKEGYETIYKLYPDEKLFAGPLEERRGMVSYTQEIEAGMIGFITQKLLQYLPQSIFFSKADLMTRI